MTKEKQQIQSELENATQTADSELRADQKAEDIIKILQQQLGEMQAKANEQRRLLDDCADPPAAEVNLFY